MASGLFLSRIKEEICTHTPRYWLFRVCRKMSGKADSDDEDGGKKKKKQKRTGPSLLQLEREKYLRGGNASSSRGSKGKRRAGGDEDEDVLDALEGFRSKLFEAAKSAPPPKKASRGDGEDDESQDGAEGKPEKLHGIDLNDDELDDDVRASFFLSFFLSFFMLYPFSNTDPTSAALGMGPPRTARRLDVALAQVPQRRDARLAPGGRVRRRRPARQEQHDARRDARQG